MEKDEHDVFNNDNGFFQYDNSCPPLFITPPSHQVQDCKESMKGIVTHYLQDSYKDGMKHPDTILRNGLSAGEAGMIYFRSTHEKRKKAGQDDDDDDDDDDDGNGKVVVYSQHIIRVIVKALKVHMNIDVQTFPLQQTFQKYINDELFNTKKCQKNVMPAIKMFLNSVNLKTKGYTANLRKVMYDVEQSFFHTP